MGLSSPVHHSWWVEVVWTAVLTILSSYLAGLTGRGCWDWLVVAFVGMGRRVQAAWKPRLTFQSEGAIAVVRKDHRRPQVLTVPAEPESLSPGWISEAWSAIMTSRPFQNCLCKTSDCQLQCCEPDCVSLLHQGRDHFHRESSHWVTLLCNIPQWTEYKVFEVAKTTTNIQKMKIEILKTYTWEARIVLCGWSCCA